MSFLCGCSNPRLNGCSSCNPNFHNQNVIREPVVNGQGLIGEILNLRAALEEAKRTIQSQKERIDWMMEEHGGTVYGQRYVDALAVEIVTVRRERDALRGALRDALRFVTNAPQSAVVDWYAALRGPEGEGE